MHHVRVLAGGRLDPPRAVPADPPESQSNHHELVDELHRRLSRYSPEAREWLRRLLGENF